MTLPKWAKTHMAMNRVTNKMWGKFVDLPRDTQDMIQGALREMWRMGYRAGIRQAKTTLKRSELMACDEAREVNMVIESIRQRAIREAKAAQ